MISEMPTIHDSAHAHTAYGLGNLATPLRTSAGNAASTDDFAMWPAPQQQLFQLLQQHSPPHHHHQEEKPMADKNDKPRLRVVRVYIADPDENLPIEHAMIYEGAYKLTDLTDQELFFEIDIKNLLGAHNTKRTKQINKKVKDRTEYLEPARVRDLRMVVVNVATF